MLVTLASVMLLILAIVMILNTSDSDPQWDRYSDAATVTLMAASICDTAKY
jgi:hypothetical protein